MPDSDNPLSSLIWYKGTSYDDFKYWTESIEAFLDGKLISIYLLKMSVFFLYFPFCTFFALFL